VHIPKEKGKTRPIGISTVEDKIVQGAIREVLEAIYEQDFLPCSYGFRPGRSPHDALRQLNGGIARGEVNWVLETDVQSFFDSIDRTKLVSVVRERVVDGAMLRLIGKCLNVGVLDGEEWSDPEVGTAQGSILSPLLGNIYLHTVLDRWFESDVRPRLRGRALLVRYADDLVIGFERRDDAERVMKVLSQRLGRFGLSPHPEKTRLLPFGRPPRGGSGKKGVTFDFLGFTFYWRRTRHGSWGPHLRTRRSRLRRSITAVAEWCRRHRHDPVKEQRDGLKRRLVGHYNYYGVNGNFASLAAFKHYAARAWFKWLRRRGDRHKLTWERFQKILDVFPLPQPRIRVQLWPKSP
jgi:group II intron reverse transcriptase/maturase